MEQSSPPTNMWWWSSIVLRQQIPHSVRPFLCTHTVFCSTCAHLRQKRLFPLCMVCSLDGFCFGNLVVEIIRYRLLNCQKISIPVINKAQDVMSCLYPSNNVHFTMIRKTANSHIVEATPLK